MLVGQSSRRGRPMSHIFPRPHTCIHCGADALVRSRPTGRLFELGKHLILRTKSGSRGTRADQGVCPTKSSAFQILGKVCGIALRARATRPGDSAKKVSMYPVAAML